MRRWQNGVEKDKKTEGKKRRARRWKRWDCGGKDKHYWAVSRPIDEGKHEIEEGTPYCGRAGQVLVDSTAGRYYCQASLG